MNYFYPPIINSVMEPITLSGKLKTDDGIKIYYTDPINTQGYSHIRLRVVRQSNNLSLAIPSRWADNYIYVIPKVEEGTQKRYIELKFYDFIPEEDYLGDTIKKDSSLIGEIIKIQLAYVGGMPDAEGKTENSSLIWSPSIPSNRFEDRPVFPTYPEYTVKTSSGKIAYNYFSSLKNATFSEWSSVLSIKFIDEEDEAVINLGENSYFSSSQFSASYSFTTKSKETKDKYRFQLYKPNGSLLEDSSWLQYDHSADSPMSYRFKYGFKEGDKYTIKFNGLTVNNYLVTAKRNEIQYIENTGSSLDGRFDLEISYEDGCIDCYYTPAGNIQRTTYIISRASEKDDYAKWEELYSFEGINFKANEKYFVFTDYTLESGIDYKYCIQEERADGLRSARLMDAEDLQVCVYLPYAYLYEDGVQLKLKYNNKLSSYKHNVLINKQDTIGSKYPTILRNGNVYYAEFPINGLISLHLDDGQRFFKETEQGYGYKGELIIPKSKYGEETFNTNLTGVNFYIERIFREKVEEFLNNGKPKIFRSPVIGNHVVVLTGISLSPNQTLGGLVAEFSGTAYEIMEFDYNKLVELGVLPGSKI